jgi:hypothetical protein
MSYEDEATARLLTLWCEFIIALMRVRHSLFQPNSWPKTHNPKLKTHNPQLAAIMSHPGVEGS